MRVRATFQWMPMAQFPALRLSFQFGLLIFLSAQLLDSQIMVVDGDAQGLFGTLLAHDELVKMLFQRFGRDARGTHDTGASQRADGRLTRLVDTSETLAREVGAMVLTGRPWSSGRQGAASNAGQRKVRGPGPRGDGDDEGLGIHDDGRRAAESASHSSRAACRHPWTRRWLSELLGLRRARATEVQ